jgi:hypothetical protein
MLKYNPNELQMQIFKREMNKIANDQAALEHEKLRYSLISKANDEVLHILLDTRSKAAKLLSTQQIEYMQTDICSKSKSSSVILSNTRNELLAKGQKNNGINSINSCKWCS